MKKIKQLFILVVALFSMILISCGEVTPKLKAPTLTLEGEKLSWEAVENAISYAVFQDGEELAKGLTELEYTLNVAELEPGTYSYTVQAIADGTNYKNSVISNAVQYVVEETYTFGLESKTVVADGNKHSLALTGDALPEGYTVEFDANEFTEVGKYYVTGTIKNASGELVQNVYGILTIDNPKNEEFEAFTEELLIAIFEGDQMSINFFFNNPEDFGLEHYEATVAEAYFGDYEEGMKDIQNIIDEMEKFDTTTFSSEQKDTYEIVYRYFDHMMSITEDMNYMTNGYLGSYLGYQCNLPLELAEYKFRNEEDVKDWISLCNSTENSFKTYIQFTEKQAEKGFAMPDFVIDNVVSQCEEFVAIKETNYLIDIFADKVDEVEFLTEEEKASYKEQAKAAIQGPLTNAYQYVLENLPALKGRSTVYGGLAQFEGGQEYYNLMLQDVLGYKDITGQEAIEYLEAKLDSVNKNLNRIVAMWNQLYTKSPTEYYAFYNAVTEGTPFFSELEPEELLAIFEEKAKELVPDLGMEINTTVKIVPESLQENFSPAAYFVSPLDETKNESIYLNPKYLEDKNYIFTTLAHEGYPGHLYQRVYSKGLGLNPLRLVIRNSGYTEGWATYVELKAYDFVENYTSSGLKLALDYLKQNDVYNGLINVRLDLAINYEGQTLKEFTKTLNDLVGDPTAYTEDEAKPIFEQLIETPTNSAEYFFAWCKMDDMHTRAQKALGDLFNEVEFNTALLSKSSAPLDMYEEVIDEYIKDTLFLNGRGE